MAIPPNSTPKNVSHASTNFTNTTAVGVVFCFKLDFIISMGWLGHLSAYCFPGCFANGSHASTPQSPEQVSPDRAGSHSHLLLHDLWWSSIQTAKYLLTCKLTKHQFEQMLHESPEISQQTFLLSVTFLQKEHKCTFKDWELNSILCSGLNQYLFWIRSCVIHNWKREKKMLSANKNLLGTKFLFFFLLVSEAIHFCETPVTVSLHQFVSRLKS